MDDGAARGGQVLRFSVAGEASALPAGAVSEIIRPRTMTRVPHAPAHVLGVTNLRGTVLPVLSTAILLGREEPAATGATRILVLDRAPDMGLLVDSVASIGEAAGEDVLDLDALLAASASPLVRVHHTAARMEQAAPAATQTSPRRGLICIQAGGQDFALPLEDVLEVASLPDAIAPLPGSEAAMLGTAHYRGGLLAVLSLNDLLGLPRAPPEARGRMVVVRLGTQRVGLAVAATKDVLRVDPRSMETVPPILTRGRGEARVEAICRQENGGRLVSVLSAEHLFDSATRAMLAAHQGPEATARPRADAGAMGVRQFVVFRLGNEDYALPVDVVDEVVRRPVTLARVPRAPEFLRGAMNLRGRVVPVIDPSVRFASLAGVDVARAGNKAKGRVVVVTVGGVQAGLAVDEVHDILSLPLEALHAAPSLTASGDRMVDRIAIGTDGSRMIMVLDPKAVLDRAERDLLSDIAAPARIQAPA